MSATAEAQPTAKVIEHPEHDPSTGFDYRTHIKDAKTGKLIRIQSFARHAKSGEVLLERPIGSGNCFHENGQPAGRWDTKEWKKLAEEHAFVAPAPASKEEELAQRNEMLEREIAALKAERQPQATAQTQQKK